MGGAADVVPLNETIPDVPYAGFLEPKPVPIRYGLEELPLPPVVAGGGSLSCDDEEDWGGSGALEVTRLVGGVVER